MKLRVAFIMLMALALAYAARVSAQETSDAAQTLENLRAQMSEVQDQEANLKSRLQQLDFDLKPENIERYFSGFGSTHPEELRENRRRQLQSEKDRVLAQLDQLASTRTRLETAIGNAQARVYQQSALGKAALRPNPNRGTRFLTAGRALVGISVLVMVLGGIVLRAVIRRRRKV